MIGEEARTDTENARTSAASTSCPCTQHSAPDTSKQSTQHSALSTGIARTQHPEPRTQNPSLSTSTLLELVLLAGIFILNFFMSTDPDMWWHLAAGRFILDTGSVPQTDPFSYTAAGRHWVAHEWLAEVAMYLLYQAGGYLLPVVFFAALVATTFWVLFRTLRLLTVGVAGAAAITFWAAFMSLAGWNVRPQIFSYLFFAVYLFILLRSRWRTDQWIWVLPAIMALWVNLHGAFVLGLALGGLVLVGEALRTAAGGARADALSRRELGRLALCLALAVAACTLNPSGVRVWAYVRQLQVDPASQTFVSEWQVPDIKDISDVALFHGGFWIGLLVLLYSATRLNLTDLLIWGAFAVLGLGARRNGIWFALAAAPIVARHAAALELPRVHLPARLPQRRTASTDGAGEPSRLAQRLNVLIVALLAGLTLLLSPWVRPHLAPSSRWGLIERRTPIAAMDYLAVHSVAGNIFHPQEYGDYLIWRLWPATRSFLDGRVHLFSGEFVRAYVLTLNDDDWESRLVGWDIRYLLLPKGDKQFARILQDARESVHWELLFEDDVAALFVRHEG